MRNDFTVIEERSDTGGGHLGSKSLGAGNDFRGPLVSVSREFLDSNSHLRSVGQEDTSARGSRCLALELVGNEEAHIEETLAVGTSAGQDTGGDGGGHVDLLTVGVLTTDVIEEVVEGGAADRVVVELCARCCPSNPLIGRVLANGEGSSRGVAGRDGGEGGAVDTVAELGKVGWDRGIHHVVVAFL